MKFKKYLFLLLLPLIFLATGCNKDEVTSYSKNLSTYTIDVTYNEDHTLSCKQTVNYKNRTDTTLENVMFHLYPQSFRLGAKSSVVSSLTKNVIVMALPMVT